MDNHTGGPGSHRPGVSATSTVRPWTPPENGLAPITWLSRHLLEGVSRDHFPRPPATPEEIEAFEQRVGWPLDPDLRAFYLHCSGVLGSCDALSPPRAYWLGKK